jgi:lipopolysaccharide biosynthesis glycosyltransferase
MFDPTLDIRGRILYLDLDVVICNNIDKLVVNLNKEFMGIRDFNRKFHTSWKMLNSSAMSWVHGSQSDIWDRFVANPNVAQRMHGDQDWTWHIAKDRIKFWPIEWIQSYKWEIRSREELICRTGKTGFKTVAHNLQVHPELSIAVFHGSPDPHQVSDPFVVDNWR